MYFPKCGEKVGGWNRNENFSKTPVIDKIFEIKFLQKSTPFHNRNYELKY